MPLLFSLPQMRNLRFTLELSPEAVFLTSVVFGYKRVRLKASTSNHMVLDLCAIEGLPEGLSKIVMSHDINPNFPSFTAAEEKPQPESAQAEEPIEEALVSGFGKCPACEGRHRVHNGRGEKCPLEARQKLMDQENNPTRVTLKAQPKKVRLSADSDVPGLVPPATKSDPKMPKLQSGSDAVSSGEGLPVEPAQAEEEEIPPPPEPHPSTSNMPAALLKLHKRLNKEVELYKLHVKHYHMSLSQFKRRTTQLALPDTVYEKYDKICKSCQTCANVKGAPSRSRVSGIRAENFGDIIFVDHAEVKVKGGSILVLFSS